MDRSSELYLIKKTFEQDALLQPVPVETKRMVYCNVRSVSQSEFFSAGAAGLKASKQVTMFGPEYEGEEEVELDGIRYAVYRTYQRRNESLELYLQRKVGI